MPAFAPRRPATDNGAVDGRGPGPRERRRRGARRLAAAVLAVVLLAAASAGCAGRKGRNDDDPGPHEYSTSLRVEPVVRAAAR